jgi:murein DD-endopeptidase MepM/ murein hydrolase activator NlpD
MKKLCQQSVGTVLDWMGKTIPLRQRHVFTRNKHLRLRYVASSLAVTGLTLTLAGMPHGVVSPSIRIAPAGPAQVAALSQDQAQSLLAFYHKRLERYGADAVATAAETAAIDPAGPKTIPASVARPQDKVIRIGAGDTMTSLLRRAGIAADEAYSMVQALKTSYDPRYLKPGAKVAVHFLPSANGYNVARVAMPIDATKSVTLEKARDGSYKTTVVQQPVETKVYARSTAIDGSFYASASKAGMPSGVIADMIKVYSYDVDFQRDLHHGDVAQVLYDQTETASGDFVKSGNLIYARLIVGGRSIPVYRYDVNGVSQFYTAEGRSIRKALMRTPVDGARISSGFGMRFHPVLGYTKMHKGIDFAAPIGTPIFAAGNGVIEKCGPFSSYGNYIRIRHSTTMETAYAHMSRFADGMHDGVRVQQGDVIGYIGRTGRVTGPHLHYEILINGTQVNPAGVSVAQNDALDGKQLAIFKTHVAKVNQQFQALSGSLRVATNRDSLTAIQ